MPNRSHLLYWMHLYIYCECFQELSHFVQQKRTRGRLELSMFVIWLNWFAAYSHMGKKSFMFQFKSNQVGTKIDKKTFLYLSKIHKKILFQKLSLHK